MNKSHQEHQDKAQEIVDSFKPYVQVYYGMSDDEEEILKNARKCAHIAIDREIKDIKEELNKTTERLEGFYYRHTYSSLLINLTQIKELIDTTK